MCRRHPGACCGNQVRDETGELFGRAWMYMGFGFKLDAMRWLSAIKSI